MPANWGSSSYSLSSSSSRFLPFVIEGGARGVLCPSEGESKAMVDSASSCADKGRGDVVVVPVTVSSSSTVSSYVCDCSVSSCTADSSWSGAS